MLVTDGVGSLAREMYLLAKHVRSYQCEPALGHPEAALTIVIVVLADNHAIRDDGARVDDRVINTAIPADTYIRQYN